MMIKPFMSRAQKFVARQKNLRGHIRLLENRYSELEMQEAVELLQKLFSQIPNEKDEIQAKSKIQTRI